MSTSTLEDPLTQRLADHGIDTQTGSRRWHHPVLFDRVVWRLVSQQGLDASTARKAVDAGWGFLELCAARPELPLSPTPAVDAAWHETILSTRQYVEFCAALGVQGIIYHEPFDQPAVLGGGGAKNRDPRIPRSRDSLRSRVLAQHRRNRPSRMWQVWSAARRRLRTRLLRFRLRFGLGRRKQGSGIAPTHERAFGEQDRRTYGCRSMAADALEQL